MARTNKRSRIKGLPPKIYLRTRDAHTGSYPSQVRSDIDGLTGNYPILWDDTNTMVFTTQSNNLYLGVNVEKSYLDKSVYAETYGKDLSSSLGTGESDVSVTGSIRKGVSDVHVGFTPGDPYKPFNEHKHDDIKSTQYNNPFYVSGSLIEDVGEGFSQPLWSKTKIVVDITPSSLHSVYMTNYTSQNTNYPMAYWNKDLRVWEGIGTGKEFVNYECTEPYNINTVLEKHQSFYEEQCIGFSPTIEDNTTNTAFLNAGLYYNTGDITSNFGFPLHPKFSASSSNVIKMSDYINQPFLLEKIVLDISCTYNENRTNITPDGVKQPSGIESSMVSFFLLNQKREKLYSENQITVVSSSTITSIIVTSSIPSILNGTLIQTSRDVIGWCDIVSLFRAESYYDGSNALKQKMAQVFSDREKIIYSDSPESIPTKTYVSNSITFFSGYTDWTSNLRLDFTAKNPLKTDNTNIFLVSYQYLSTNPVRGKTASVSSNQFFGRKGANVPNARDKLNSISNTNKEYAGTMVLGSTTVGMYGYSINDKTNPYLLLPNDELILGVQLPMSKYVNKTWTTSPVGESFDFINGKGSELTFAPYPSKITLYGSYIKEGKEYHDTATIPLTSDSIHEVIGED